MSTLDLDEIRPWVNPCGVCDFGLPTLCTCPKGDPRIPMAKLFAEVERLRRDLAANEDSEDARLATAEAEVERLRREVGTYREVAQGNKRNVATLAGLIEAVESLCRSYTPEPPPLFRGPGLSEQGLGYNRGTRDLAEAVLATLRGAPADDDVCCAECKAGGGAA